MKEGSLSWHFLYEALLALRDRWKACPLVFFFYYLFIFSVKDCWTPLQLTWRIFVARAFVTSTLTTKNEIYLEFIAIWDIEHAEHWHSGLTWQSGN